MSYSVVGTHALWTLAATLAVAVSSLVSAAGVVALVSECACSMVLSCVCVLEGVFTLCIETDVETRGAGSPKAERRPEVWV